MPPRYNVPATIKLKSGKKTMMLLLPESATFSELKTQLLKAIVDTWSKPGIDQISVPKPSFDTAGDESPALEEPANVSLDDLRVAVPADKSDLSKGWKEIGSDSAEATLASLGISDGSTLAYSVGSDSKPVFAVEFPSFEDEAS